MTPRFLATSLALLLAVPAYSQSTSKLEKQNEQILEELKAMRGLLEKLVAGQAGPTRPDTPVAVKVPVLPSSYTEGRADAPITILEFTDLQCPFCRQFRSDAYPEIGRELIATGKVRFLSYDFPLSSIHPLAEAAAKASRCAADLGKGPAMREAILMNNERLSPELFTTLARDLGLDAGAFAACTADAARFASEMKANQAYAATVGVDGTPTFVIGRTAATTLEGDRFSGALPYAAFKSLVDKALATVPTK